MPLSYAAPGGVPPSCDQDYLDVLEARARLGGKREMELAQTLILRPDSVLEYSCFSVQLQNMRDNPILAYDTDDSINGLDDYVGDSMTAYLNANFGHSLGGGTVSATPSSPCATMNTIFSALQCSTIDSDTFLSLQNLTGAGDIDIRNNDPRQNPNVCGGAAETERNTTWDTALGAAFPAPASPAASGGQDTAQTFFNILDPTDCNAAPAVETGLVTFTLVAGTTFLDKVCPAPSCQYDNVSDQCCHLNGSGDCNP